MTIKQTSFCTFVLDFKSGSVTINPAKKTETDIVIYSDPKSGYLNFDEVKSGLVVKNAGEFEIKDIFVDGQKNRNSETFIYNISADEVTIGVVSLTADMANIPAEFFETTDVLLIGAGSGPFLSPADAHDFVNKVAPSVAIFFGFKEGAHKDVAGILDSVEEAKKDIPSLQLAEKTLKIDKDYVDGLETTVSYYFEI